MIQTKNSWIPISTIPDTKHTSSAMNMVPVLLSMKDREHYPNPVIGYYFGGLIKGWRVGGNPGYSDEPTHWMPMPEQPELL